MSTAPQPTKAGSFGERLRREREMRGIKLEEIAESTKIGKRNLEALEEEHFDQLPGGIFNKGFVRAYAKYLGLDEEQAVNDFLAASANYDQPAALQPLPASWVKPPVMPSEESVQRRNRLWALAALAALIAGLAWWFYVARTPASASNAGATNARLAQPPSSASNADAPQNSAPSANVSSVASTATLPGVTLNVQATQEAWLLLTADGQPLSDVTLARGESRDFHARRELVLKTGNAGGLEITLNGKILPALGKDKQVRTITFTAQGIKR